MSGKLILIEGLPGFGKTSTAKLVRDILGENNNECELFLEGNLDHPADYEGVAFFPPVQFNTLLVKHQTDKELITKFTENIDKGYLVQYQKMKKAANNQLPDELLHNLSMNDIYELPLEQHIELIADKWEAFTNFAANNQKTFIFECCFIQNPITMSMIKYGVPDDIVMEYVFKLESIIKHIDPILIYIEQKDLEFSFKKAIDERSKAWLDFFIPYYTDQGYGKKHGYKNLDGAFKVLEARKKVELQLFDKLTIQKVKVDNSHYNFIEYKQMLTGILRDYFKGEY